MNSALARTLIFPTALAIRGELEFFRELDRLGTIGEGEDGIGLIQRRRLRRVLEAAGHTPYYRSLMGDGPVRGDPKETLRSLPFLTKSELQSRFELLQNPFVRRRSRKTTGGSTGQAVTLFKNPDAIARERAATAMAYSWFGVRLGDQGIRFWGSPSTSRRKLKSRLADLAVNRHTVSAFAFDDQDLDEYWELCRRLRPTYFYGYASMLEEFARHVHRRGYDGQALGLRAVISTAEPLTSPRREVIRQAFGAPVQNEYGCGEVGPIAYECRSGSLHVMSQNLIVEIVSESNDPCPPGTIGRIVVTDLNNRALPLIRYEVGDLAAWGTGCTCTLPFPVLGEVLGRQYDYLEDGAGRRYHGEAVMYIFEDLRDRGFQIHSFEVQQSRSGHAELRLVAPDAPAELDDLVRRLFAERLGGLQLDVERRCEIPRIPSGKRRLIRRIQ